VNFPTQAKTGLEWATCPRVEVEYWQMEHSLDTLAAIFTAIGTVAVAILAIWGDWVRARLVGPKLELALRDPRGELNTRNDGKRELYYHIEVTNGRKWSPARQARVMLTEVEKKIADGSFVRDPLIPLQLTWAYSAAAGEMLPTIVANQTCDLGCLTENGDRFRLTTYSRPNNFHGFIIAGQTMRATVVAMADNVQSLPLCIEISWDGKWSADSSEMQRHLVVKQAS
jgi:hypothetical protein